MAKMKRKNFIWHTLFCLFALFALIAMTLASGSIIYNISDNAFWGYIVLFIAFVVHIIFIVYYYFSSKGYSLFALPLSHILVIIVLFIVAVIVSDGWLFAYLFLFSAFYLLPIAVIAFVISLVARAIRKRTMKSTTD